MPKYEVKTMRKDIEELRKKMKISDSELTELLGTERGAPPEGLPIAESIKPIEPPKLKKEPEKPVELEKPPSPPRPPQRKKSILPVVILVLILLIIGGGVYYWWNYLRVPKEESPVEKPEVEIPASLIEVGETKIVELEEDGVLFEKLKELASQEQELDNFQRILVKKIGKEKDYFLSFQEIVEILYVNIPYNISSKLDLGGEYTLFLYTQEEGNRLGFVNKVSDFENLAKNLKSWEEDMQADMRPIFLGRVLGFPATEEFQDNIYQEINIRYLNFPDPFLTIDYALVGEHLIITTSRESIYKVIDKILGE